MSSLSVPLLEGNSQYLLVLVLKGNDSIQWYTCDAV